MKLIIFAIDALPPRLILDNIHMFPNIKSIMEKGVFSDYDAYAYGYGSSDNWVSLYTGLTPYQHGIVNNSYKNEKRLPNMNDYKDKIPFWNLLNEENISVGIWKALATTPPQDINGYMISGEISYENNGEKDIYVNSEPIVVEKDKYLLKYIKGNIEEAPVPKGFSELGIEWSQLKNNETDINEIVKEDYFHEAVEYLKKNLEYFKENITRVQKNVPVDVCFFYTPLIDYIGHFSCNDPLKKDLLESIKIIDEFIGEIILGVNPENIMVLSDHGIKGWYEEFPESPKEIQEEMFGLSENAIWLKNGTIVLEARNGGFLSACHDIKGTFIAAGNDIRKTNIDNMRTVDFYPTLLELFNIRIPKDREGFVLDIFNKNELLNKEHSIKNCNSKCKIAIIQDLDIPNMNKIINEIFLKNRFSEITVFGKEKYKETFLLNSRVSDFIQVDDKINRDSLIAFDRIVIPYLDKSKSISFYEI